MVFYLHRVLLHMLPAVPAPEKGLTLLRPIIFFLPTPTLPVLRALNPLSPFRPHRSSIYSR
jgi:hypothetical protein